MNNAERVKVRNLIEAVLAVADSAVIRRSTEGFANPDPKAGQPGVVSLRTVLLRGVRACAPLVGLDIDEEFLT